MRRSIIVHALLILVALAGASGARAQGGGRAEAPPDPVTLKKEVPPDRVTLEEFKALRAAGQVFVLDVRYQIDKKIKGARHIPLEQLEARLAELPRDREIVTYCS
jgi:hypothetical protein